MNKVVTELKMFHEPCVLGPGPVAPSLSTDCVPLLARFQAFEHSQRDINTLFEAWDRTTGSVFISESEKSDMEQDTAPVPVGKKGLASHKKMEKEKEKEREKEREREKEKSKEASFFSRQMPDLSFNHSIHLSLFKLNSN